MDPVSWRGKESDADHHVLRCPTRSLKECGPASTFLGAIGMEKDESDSARDTTVVVLTMQLIVGNHAAVVTGSSHKKGRSAVYNSTARRVACATPEPATRPVSTTRRSDGHGTSTKRAAP